jgi:hypothetical protein
VLDEKNQIIFLPAWMIKEGILKLQIQELALKKDLLIQDKINDRTIQR